MSKRNFERAWSVIPKHDLTWREIAVLLAVADRTSDEDFYWESRGALARRFGKPSKPLSEVFKRFVELGLLEERGSETAWVDMSDAERDFDDGWLGVHTGWTKRYVFLPGVPDPAPPSPPQPTEDNASPFDKRHTDHIDRNDPRHPNNAPPAAGANNHRPQPGVGETVFPEPRPRTRGWTEEELQR